MCIFCRNQEKEKTMKKSQIINYLKLISDELTDAYHLTDTDGTVNANYAVSTAQELVDELTNRLENPQEEPVPHEDMKREGGLMGADRLPLNFPYHINDGEGRLKGNN